MLHDAAQSDIAGSEQAHRWPAGWPIALFAVLAALNFTVYRSALAGEFLSDDYGYIVTSMYTSELSRESVLAIIDPMGPAKLYTANYAPVHLLATALERQIFADDVRGYHWVNLLMHAANSVLLVALLIGSGIPRVGALLGGLMFSLHPANVEAVAWISQLKTNGALALSLGALLLHRRHPALAVLVFSVALLTKAAAASVLPAAAAFVWVRRGSSREWAWLGAWAVILALYSIPQFGAFAHLGSVDVPAYDDPWVHLRTIAGVGMRYLVMATTSYGVSAFQEPPPATSWLDPWWLSGVFAGMLLTARAWMGLRRRREEAAYWVFAAASFVPVSQIFPFLHPVADRYLYFIYPGLIGGSLLAGVEILKHLATRRASRRATHGLGGLSPDAVARGMAVGVLGLATLFGLSSAERAKLWRRETFLLVDAAAHYPEGGTASFLRARRAAQSGDVDTAVTELRAASHRGIDSFSAILGDAGLAPIAQTPAFRALVREVAGRWIDRARVRGYSTQAELRMLGHAHLVREEYDQALVALEGAERASGPLRDVVTAELEALRGAIRAGGSGPEGE